MWIVKQYIKYLFLLLLLWAIIWVYGNYGCARSQGNEMEPTIPKDKVMFTIPPPKMFEDLNRGDIVYYEYYIPREHQNGFIGRVIGTPSDRIRIDRGTVFVNGDKLATKQQESSSDNLEEIIVPSNSYFILCDNRARGVRYDSRTIGPVGKGAILGKIR
ncbi:MAG: signal peptidase I [Planctomycetes bacterium RBG_16_43_13]|nr:MAG: signal peptidase I [Planctomycetes bacterium RBG_16_43_13]